MTNKTPRSLCGRMLALAAAAACLMCLSACEQEMPKRLDGQYSSGETAVSAPVSDDAPASASSGETDETDEADKTDKTDKKIAAPRFQSGRYVMAASSVSETTISQGNTTVSYAKDSQTYTYGIALTVKKDGSLTAVYTFDRIVLGYETQDEAGTLDTDDPAGRGEYTAVYYDLIGQSFTASVAKNGQISLKGIDAIHRQFPDTAAVVKEDNMRDVVGDLFYPLADSLGIGTSWQLTQSGIANTYRVSSISAEKLFMDIAGGALSLPQPYTQDGITYTYTSCDPLRGSLVIDRADRMLQEQASYQEIKGTCEYGGETLHFTQSASSGALITKQA